MRVWKNIARNLPRVSIILLLFCVTLLVAQEETAKTPPPPPTQTVVVNGVSEPVYKVRDGVTPPRAIYSQDPEFSEEARRQKVQGTVVLDIIVTSAGKATQIRVTQGRGYGLDEKAVEAVSKWKFEPATKDGKPVSVEIAVEVDFRLWQRP
jgi:TonB family protein